MLCPKCRMEQDDRNLLCDYCGVVFARYRPEPAAAAPEAEVEAGGVVASRVRDDGPALVAEQASGAERRAAARTEATFTVYEPAGTRILRYCRERLLAAPPVTSLPALAGRATLALFLAVWAWRLATPSLESNAAGTSFLHLVNLPFHEAGHVLFMPFGDFVRTLGGSLAQLLMPLTCCLVLLLKTRDPFGAAVALWWFGENFLDLAPYIDDAGTGELPLLGGNTGESTPYGFHDWEYLMTETGRLGQEHEFARAVHGFGAAVMVFALAWMAITLWRGWRAGRAAGGSGAAPERELRRAA